VGVKLSKGTEASMAATPKGSKPQDRNLNLPVKVDSELKEIIY